MRRGGGGSRAPPPLNIRGGGARKKHYFERAAPKPSDDDEDEDCNAARASRRRRLEALRAEVSNETDPTATDAWQRMLKEREELTRRAAAQRSLAQTERPDASSLAAVEEDIESMDISDCQSDADSEPNDANAVPQTAEQEVMTQLLGFTAFGTTKGRSHADAELSGVRKKTKRKYRQYMNRKGGFNRPLSPVF